MELRISSGLLKGRKIIVPEKITDFRPTKSSVKEAIVSSIAMDIPNAKVLELCGGSGIFSFEMISRGAEYSDIVESDKERSKFIDKTAKNIGLGESINISSKPVDVFLNNLDSTKMYDIIFFDPPYYMDTLADLIPQILNNLDTYGVFIFEAAKDDNYCKDIISKTIGYKTKMKKYGKTVIYYLREEI